MSNNPRVTRDECEAYLSEPLAISEFGQRLALAAIVLLDSGEQTIQQLQNPWTVEILNQKDGGWTDFCHDAPLTLTNAEKRESELKADNPGAVFRVVPWFNSSQRQALQQERELSDKLAEALKQMVDGQPWRYLSCCKGGPTKDCKLCGRYYDANAARRPV